MTKVLYLNGEYVSFAEAKASVFDRVFMYGDGEYEVIFVYSGMSTLTTVSIKWLSFCLSSEKSRFSYYSDGKIHHADN